MGGETVLSDFEALLANVGLVGDDDEELVLSLGLGGGDGGHGAGADESEWGGDEGSGVGDCESLEGVASCHGILGGEEPFKLNLRGEMLSEVVFRGLQWEATVGDGRTWGSR